LVRFERGIYHVLPLDDIQHGRLYRISRIPKAWYGAGPTDPNFFSDSGLRNIALSLHMGPYANAVNTARRAAPYAVDKKQLHFLTRAGIDHPPPMATSHPHPVHYALENQSLNLVSRMLGGRWHALFLNPAKINYLNTLGATAPTGFFNPRYDGKDVTRYLGTNIPTMVSPRSSSPVWFAHDVLHHLSPTTVGGWFDSNPSLQYLICTTVIPPETVFGLESQRPALYDFMVEGDTLTYVPEGDAGGVYTQPYSARRWLSTREIISPANLCLHTALLSTTYAHHVMMISRPLLQPQKTRVLDMADLTVIPWQAHPWSTMEQRLTLPSLDNALIMYATRVSATSIRDLHAKVAAHASETYDKFPASYVRAAVLHAVWLRAIDYHNRISVVSFLWMNLLYFSSFPFVTPGWFWQSVTSTLFQQKHDKARIWQTHTSSWISQGDDSVLPGVDAPYCKLEMDYYQLPPNPNLRERFTVLSAKLVIWLGLKTAGFVLHGYIQPIIWAIPDIVDYILYHMDISVWQSPVGILISLLIYWYGIHGPSIPLPFRGLWSWFKIQVQWLYACIFFLPSARLPFSVGYSWSYIITLDMYLLTHAFPKFHPVTILMESFLWYTPDYGSLRPDPHGDVVHLEPAFNITAATTTHQHRVAYIQLVGYQRLEWWLIALHFTAFCLSLIPLVLQCWRRRAYSPIHDCEAQTDCFQPYQNPPTPSESTSATSTPPPSPQLSPSTATNFELSPNPNTGWVDVDLPAAPAAMQQPPDPDPVIPAMPVLNVADPYSRYNIPPLAFDDFNDWAQLLSRLAIPPNNLDVNQMCLWDCLSATLGVDGRLLYGNYVASLPPAQRGALLTGQVLHDQIPRILAHFRLTYVVRAAISDEDGCPRSPGNQQPLPQFNPQAPPLFEAAGSPTYPTLTMFTQLNPEGTYHATLQAHPTVNVNVPPPGRDAWVGWPSILVPSVEVGEVVNIPARAFATVYNRMLGGVTNFLSRNAAAGRFANFVLPAVPVREQIVMYVPTANDGAHAHGLASDITVKPNVLNLHEFNMHDTSRTIKQMAKDWQHFIQTGQGLPRAPVRLHLFHGAYGTGKSFALSAVLRAAHAVNPFHSANLAFHTWDHDLREPLMNGVLAAFPGIGLQPNNFMTGCMPLALPRAGTVVFDDAGKCWNSFIPLFIACNPGVTDIYLTFDAAQAQGVFPEAPSISRKHPATGAWLSRLSDYYATLVLRTAHDVTELYGFPIAPHIPGRIIHRGQIIIVSKSPAGVPLLAVSPRFTQTQNMAGQVADTFTECQGHTIYGDVCIDLGGLTATAAEASTWTALTRATGNIYLKMGASMPTAALIESGWSSSQILTAILTVASVARTPYITAAVDNQHLIKSAVMSHISRSLSPAAAARLGMPAPNPIVGVRAGVGDPWRSEWLEQTDKPSEIYTAKTHRAVRLKGRTNPSPAFSRHTVKQLNEPCVVADIVRHHTSLPNSSILNTEPSQYRLPPDPVLTAVPDPMLDMNPPTDDILREIVVPGGASSFQHIVDGAPDALHHVRADRVTDEAGMNKRIRRGHYDGGWSTNDTKRLKQLKAGFKKFFDVGSWNDQPFDHGMMEYCTDAKLSSWASKRTKKALEYSVFKQNLDMPWNVVRLFPKGQYIKKKAKWRGPAFPSQTISDFNLGRIFHDSPWALYLETMALKYAYDSTYLHCRASPDHLSAWYRRHWIPGSQMVACDYTSWDSGMDHVTVEFVCWLMALNHFPEDEIDLYRFHRYNTSSHLGDHLPRQESGDRWTWLINSLVNAAVTGAAIDCPPRTPATFSGDDGNVLGRWFTTVGFKVSDWLMKPKVDRGTRLEFCGLIFGGPDISYDDAVVHWRARFGLQQGRNDIDYWRSIRDAIRESASKLGTSTTALSNARLQLHRAVDWFSLPQSLKLPDHYLEAPIPDAVDHVSSLFSKLLAPIRFLLFL